MFQRQFPPTPRHQFSPLRRKGGRLTAPNRQMLSDVKAARMLRLRSFKTLDRKSLKRQTKAEELGTRGPELLSPRLSLKAL